MFKWLIKDFWEVFRFIEVGDYFGNCWTFRVLWNWGFANERLFE